MNTQLKQVLISQIDDSVNKGYFATEQEAVEEALIAIRSKEIMATLEERQQEIKQGKVSSFDGIAQRVNAKLKAKLESQAG